MSELEAFKRIIIRDRKGKIKFDSGLEPSNSFVIAFLETLYTLFANVSYAIEDVGNTARNIADPSDGAYMKHRIGAGDNDDSYGIVVGTGVTVETNIDYALATKIAHGTGADQLDYGDHSFTAPAVVGNNVDLVVSRSFYNGSGASITVKEIGVYCDSQDSGGNHRYFCILRDVLTTPGVVNNTETLTVQYTFRTTA